MEIPWLIIPRKKLRDHRAEIVAKDRVIAGHMADIETLHVTVRQREAQSARDVFQLTETAKHSVALTAEKQQEIGRLRQQITELNEERKQLVDWITKGMTGMPVFAKVEREPEPAEEPKKPFTGTEPIESDITQAIRAAGRHPRSVVKYVEAKHEKEFAESMQSLGVRKVFQEDKEVAQAEAELSKSA